MGGVSGERSISLSTGRQILRALDPNKYTVAAVDPASLAPEHLRPAMSDVPEDVDLAPLDLGQWAQGVGRPDVVCIALHGRYGEDGTIQGALELLGIPYTGSGVLASALAIDKVMTKRVLKASGVPTPAEVVLDGARATDLQQAAAYIVETLGLPCVVKPNREGSTIGCSIVRSRADIPPALAEAFRYDGVVLAEEYIEGVEITAGLLGNNDPEVLPLIEIVPRGGFYDWEAKYAPGGSVHIIPARVSEKAAERARAYARAAHTLLGCRGMSRVDMIVRGDQPYVLEVNTIPGMTPTSLLPEAARAAGIEFSDFLDRIVQYALQSQP